MACADRFAARSHAIDGHCGLPGAAGGGDLAACGASRHSPPEHASGTPQWPKRRPAKIAKLVANAGDRSGCAASELPSQRQPAAESTAEHGPAHDSPAARQPVALAPPRPVIELDADKEIPAASLRLQPGTIVRGKGDQRPRMLTPATGLAVTADNVRFENIDFLWRQRPEAITTPDRQALVDLRAAHAEFVGCTFQAVAAGSSELPPAVRLAGNSQRSALAPAGQVRFERCALTSVACGVDCALAAPAAVEVCNTLYLGSGALVRFSQPRRSDAPASVTLRARSRCAVPRR